MSCLAHSTYVMQADIYEATTTTEPILGMSVNTWSLKETVSCFARGVLGSQLGGNSAQVEIKDFLINSKDFIKMRTSIPLSSEYRIVAIRNEDGVIWTEDYIQNSAGGVNGATIFEPSGTTPLLDFNGKVIEYETVLKRQEIQSLEVS
jgi:hypothetical protein